MARQSFSRTIVYTFCEADYFDENNERIQTSDVKLLGDYDIKTAQQPALKQLKAIGGVVTKVRHESYYGTLSIEEFDKYCSKKNFKEW